MLINSINNNLKRIYMKHAMDPDSTPSYMYIYKKYKIVLLTRMTQK